MSLTRERLLAEMGIAPLWVRRDAQPVGAPETSAVPAAVEPTPSETGMDVETPAFEAPPRADVPGFTADANPAALTWPQIDDAIRACRACSLGRCVSSSSRRCRTTPGLLLARVTGSAPASRRNSSRPSA